MKESLILIHASPLETRVALVEDGRLAELFQETDDVLPLVGNIYKGRVMRVLPGMQAAFVEIGLDKAGFLYVGDVDTGAERDPDVEPDDNAEISGGQARIEDLVKEGQELLVQITKAPIGTKGARLTSYLTIPGRHLVLSPGSNRVGVSRKIRLARERTRLRHLLQALVQDGAGLIGRTVAEGCTAEELEADRDYLMRIWHKVQERERKQRAPSVVYSELTMPLRVLRDVLNPRYRKILVDDPGEHQRVREFVQSAIPGRTGDVELYRGKRPMFETYGVEKQFREALKPQVNLPSGGGLVVEETEALTTVDVNTWRFVGSRNLEDTVLKTNLEAVTEICRQLRLRNLGGILILDFIDMDLPDNRTRVYNALKEELRKDRARTSILKISELGLVEMTRQRMRESLSRSVGTSCPHCQGRGYLMQPRVLAAALYRELLGKVSAGGNHFEIRAHPWVTDWLFDEAMPYLEALEQQFSCRFRILPDAALPEEHWEIAVPEPFPRRRAAR